MKAINILLLFLILICVIPPVSAGVAQILWTNQTTANVCITALDTNSLGTLVLAGLGNGTILAYDATGNISWAYNTNNTAPNAAIKKMVADSNGNIAWISMANESGFVSSSGAVGGIVHDTGRNITDVALSGDGSLYVTSELYPPRLVIHNQDGSTYAQNTSFNGGNWTKIGYDPSNTWLVTANQSDDTLYFWNISTWIGWGEFNPTKSLPKNSSQLFLDTFPFRENISLLGAATDSKGIVFINVTNVTDIIKINASAYFYNTSMMGRYFYWTLSGNLSNEQLGLLNMSRLDGDNYYVVFRPNFTNYTFYFGNTTFSNQILNQTFSNNNVKVFVNFTSNMIWQAPTGVQAVNATIVGAGGGGGSGLSYSGGSGEKAGTGGNAGTVTSISNLGVVALTNYQISIGAGGNGAGPVGPGAVGGTSSFNTSNTSAGGSGGIQGGMGSYWGGPGANGYTNPPGYPSASSGTYSSGCPAPGCYSGGSGGVGYGAGGGGGGGTSASYMSPGSGGKGADGFVSLSYFVNDVPQYYNGTIPVTAYNFSKQTQTTGNALNQTSSKDYVGVILGLSVPNDGGLVSMATDTIFYQQYMLSTGIDLTKCATLTNTGGPALFSGTPNAIAASNGGAASIEGRGNYGNIYDSGAVAKASSLVGGTVRSVDTAMTSGVFAAFGGDEGKVYMLSRQGNPLWYAYFTGSAGAKMNAVSVSWDGSVVVTGRLDGTLDYYLTNVTIPVTPTIAFTDVFVYVFKDGAIYTNQTVTIYSSASDTISWVPLGTAITDSQGRITFTTTVGTYYKFVVNNVPGTTEGEGSSIWQSNTGQNTVYIRILTPSTPYEWNAVYVSGVNNVSVIYSDSVVATSVMVTITDLKTNLVVLTRTFTSTTGFNIEYHDALGNGTYQVNILINRLGYIVRDQRIVTSPNTYGIAIPVDKYILWAISTIILMIIAGLFGYANSRRGALAVVVIAVLMMVFGLLPWTMVTVAMLAAIFAVMSLFASRVQ